MFLCNQFPHLSQFNVQVQKECPAQPARLDQWDQEVPVEHIFAMWRRGKCVSDLARDVLLA